MTLPDPSVASVAAARRLAALGAVTIVPPSLGLAIANGKSWDEAIPLAFLSGLAGLAVWRVYHLVSRRADGLITVALMTGLTVSGPTRPIGLAWIGPLTNGALLGLSVGAIRRAFDRPRAPGTDGK